MTGSKVRFKSGKLVLSACSRAAECRLWAFLRAGKGTRKGKPKRHDEWSFLAQMRAFGFRPMKNDPGDGKEAGFKPIACISDGLHYLFAADQETDCRDYQLTAVYSFDGRISFALFRPLLASLP